MSDQTSREQQAEKHADVLSKPPHYSSAQEWHDALRAGIAALRAPVRPHENEDQARFVQPQLRAGEADPRGELGAGLGLNVDMLDVDQLREWARLIDEYGPNISHWNAVAPAFVASKLRDIARRLDQEIRDVGQVRARIDLMREAFRAGFNAGWDTDGTPPEQMHEAWREFEEKILHGANVAKADLRRQ